MITMAVFVIGWVAQPVLYPWAVVCAVLAQRWNDDFADMTTDAAPQDVEQPVDEAAA